MTLKDYLRHGGIQKSLERHADASLAVLDEKEQNLSRSIFGGLIEIGRGTQDTKRTALFEELVPANASTEEVLAIVRKLADARLIITDEQAGKDTVTISHEKLIEAWPWLKKLVDENRDVIALQNEIASDAKEWEDHKRDASYLYTGARLANAREQLEANKIELSELAQTFIGAGIKAHSDELESAKRRASQVLNIGKSSLRGLVGGAVGFTLSYWLLPYVEKVPITHEFFFEFYFFSLALRLQLGAFAGFATIGTINIITISFNDKKKWRRLLAGMLVCAISFGYALSYNAMFRLTGNQSLLPLARAAIEGMVWGAVVGASAVWILASSKQPWLKLLAASVSCGLVLALSDLFLQGLGVTAPFFVNFISGIIAPLSIIGFALLGISPYEKG